MKPTLALAVCGLLCMPALAGEEDRQAILNGLRVAPIVAIGGLGGGPSGIGSAMGGGGVTAHVVFSEVVSGPKSLADKDGRTVTWSQGQEAAPMPPASKTFIWFLRPSPKLQVFQDVSEQPEFIEATGENITFLKQEAAKLAVPANEIARGLIGQNHAVALNASKGTEEELIQTTAGMAKLQLNSIMLDETKTSEEARLLYAILIVDQNLGLASQLRSGTAPTPQEKEWLDQKWRMGKRLLEIRRDKTLPEEVLKSLAD